MFVIWIWSLHEVGWIWVSVVLYVLFHCSANEPHVRYSKLRARDGAWGIHLCQASSSVPCPVAAHLCWVWKKIALSSMVCPQIPPCLGDMNHLLAILWEYLEGKSRISPMKSGLLLLGSSVTLADWAVGCCGGVHQDNSSLAETWKGLCSKRFHLTEENSLPECMPNLHHTFTSAFSKISCLASTLHTFHKKKSQKNLPDNLWPNTSIHLSATLTNMTEWKEEHEVKAAWPK